MWLSNHIIINVIITSVPHRFEFYSIVLVSLSIPSMLLLLLLLVIFFIIIIFVIIVSFFYSLLCSLFCFFPVQVVHFVSTVIFAIQCRSIHEPAKCSQVAFDCHCFWSHCWFLFHSNISHHIETISMSRQ